MKKIFLLFAVGAFLTACDSGPNPCLMSESYVKSSLNFPDEASMSFLDCNSTDQGDGTYRVLRKVTGVNAFGVEKSFIYEIILKYNGGETVDSENWELISIRNEEYR